MDKISADIRLQSLKFLDRNSLDALQLTSHLFHDQIVDERHKAGGLCQKYHFECLNLDVKRLWDVEDGDGFLSSRFGRRTSEKEQFTIPSFLADQQEKCSEKLTASLSELVGQCISNELSEHDQMGQQTETKRPKEIITYAIRLVPLQKTKNGKVLGISFNEELTVTSAGQLVKIFSHLKNIHFNTIKFGFPLNYDLVSAIRDIMNAYYVGYQLQCNILSTDPQEPLEAKILNVKLMQQGRHLVTKVLGKCEFHFNSEITAQNEWKVLHDMFGVIINGGHCFTSGISFNMFYINMAVFEDAIVKPLIDATTTFENAVPEVEFTSNASNSRRFPVTFKEEHIVEVKENHKDLLVAGLGYRQTVYLKDYYFERTNKQTGEKFKVVFSKCENNFVTAIKLIFRTYESV